MPTLRDVLEKEAGGVELDAHVDRALLDVPVVGLRLTSGAPCSTHGELFAPWPGPETNVKRWFLLANGVVVGMVEEGGATRSIAVVDAR